VYGRAAVANVTHIPLRLRGVMNTIDRRFVPGNGKARKHGLETRAGTLVVKVTGRPRNTAKANQRTCRESFTQDQRFRVRAKGAVARFLATIVLTVRK
jgi:hypothetical protein